MKIPPYVGNSGVIVKIPSEIGKRRANGDPSGTHIPV